MDAQSPEPTDTDRLARPLLDREVSVPEAIVAALADAGVEYVLGIPGGLTGNIFLALHGHPTIRTVLVREESLGSYMAEAHGRLTGRPVALMGQGEWIVGNAGQGFLESLLGSSPMIVLTEMTDGGPHSHHAVYQGGSGDFGAWDARRALEGVTKRVMVSHHPAQAVQHVQLAVKHATTGDPGPVAVLFNSTSLAGRVGPDSVPRLHRSRGYLAVPRPTATAQEAGAVADVLAGALRPVLLAGNGVRVSGGCHTLAAVAEILDIPVVTTVSGKGVFDETSPLAGGVVGAFGWPSANDLLAEADVILAVGTKLGTGDTVDERLVDPRRQHVIQVDVDPLVLGWTTPVGTAVLSDAAAFLDLLLDVASRADNGAAARVAEAGAAAAPAVRDADGAQDHDGAEGAPFTPEQVIAILNRVLPADAVVTADAGENRLFMMRWFRSRRPGGYLQPGAGGGMGHAVPSALGAKLAHPDATVVAVCGDGGFAMSIHGLMTAVEEALPVAVVVLNNRALGWVLHGMGDRAVACEFADFDHAAIARAVGCDGVRPSSIAELEAALAGVSDLERPLVIDARVGTATSFRDLLDPLDRRRAASGGY